MNIFSSSISDISHNEARFGYGGGMKGVEMGWYLDEGSDGRCGDGEQALVAHPRQGAECAKQVYEFKL